MISEDASVEEQPIDEDGLQLLKDDLDKYFKNQDNADKNDENKTLKILKILMKKKITVELLKATKIGKTISQINDKKEDFF